jgi:hypothetical protein
VAKVIWLVSGKPLLYTPPSPMATILSHICEYGIAIGIVEGI